MPAPFHSPLFTDVSSSSRQQPSQSSPPAAANSPDLSLFREKRSLSSPDDYPRENKKKSIEDDSTLLQPLSEENATTSFIAKSPQDQLQEVEALKNSPLIEGECWCLVSVKWYNAWKCWIESGGKTTHPGPVDNTDLYDRDGTLRDGLAEPYDVIFVPLEAWENLVAWNGPTTSDPIKRYVIRTGLTGNPQIELYPLHLHVSDYTSPTITYPLIISRVATVRQLKEKACEQLGVPCNDGTRLWAVDQINRVKVMDDEQVTLERSPLQGLDGVMIEIKTADGMWPTAEDDQLLPDVDIIPSSTSSSNSSSSTALVRTSLSRTSFDDKPSYLLPSSSSSSGWYGSTAQPQHTRGVCGLMNLGNTCFMNSALQCLSNTVPLTKYFLSGRWREEVNETNPLGMKGEVANAYGQLITKLWSGEESVVAPRELKWTISRFAPQFTGYQQHDSQELLAFLLDGLHEDLNRIHQKPYVDLSTLEAKPNETLSTVADRIWNYHKSRNDSSVVDFFMGQFKSRVVCPECGKVSVTFDPFMYLSLQLPMERTRKLDITYIPLPPSSSMSSASSDHVSSSEFYQVSLSLPYDSSCDDLLSSLATTLSLPSTVSLRMVEIYNGRVFKVFSEDEEIRQIQSRDLIAVYEVRNEEPKLDAPRPEVEPKDEFLFGAFRNAHADELSSGLQTNNISDTPESSEDSVDHGQEEDEREYPFLLHLNETGPSSTSSYTFSSSTKKGFGWPVVVYLKRKTTGREMYCKAIEALSKFTKLDITQKHSDFSSEDTASTSTSPQIPPTNGLHTPPSENSDYDSRMQHEPEPEENDHMQKESAASFKLPKWFKLKLMPQSARQTDIFQPVSTSYSSWNYSPAPKNDEISRSDNIVTLSPGGHIGIEMHAKYSRHVFEDNGEPPNERFRKTNRTSSPTSLHINDCLEDFLRPEKLSSQNLWYCPVCKEHQQAEKKVDLWRVPEVLVIQLKRFRNHAGFREKVGVKVGFDFEWEMSKFVEGESEEAQCEVYEENGVNGENCKMDEDESEMVDNNEGGDKGKHGGKKVVYDLFAISNHFGGLGGGHYTAFAKNHTDDKWYDFDDSHTSVIDDLERVKTESAYVLFYQRRR